MLLGLADGEASRRCAQHRDLSSCVAFRRQHGCVWDVPSATCLRDTPCDQRTQDNCAFELTTGAPWDATSNKCFYDGQECRWSDECTTASSASSCASGSCAWERRCTAAGTRERRECTHLCLPSTAATAASARRRRLAPTAAAANLTLTPVVDLPAGPVRGLRSELVDTFLGMPFAAAPIGESGRWAPPQPLAAWNSALDATSFGAACQQDAGAARARDASACASSTRDGCAGFSEDCLQLNAYVPRSTARRAEPLPVMVWIHGGCFVSGRASSYNGTELAVTQDVIVVTISYRLGAFGHLGHDALRARDPSEGSTGNYGLQDAVAALRWLSDNVGALGGDPSRVTIFGESSGAGTVSQLLGYEASWPFWSRAILESGAASFWTQMPMLAAYHAFDRVVAATDCGKTGEIDTQIACLVAAPADTVASAVTSAYCRDGCAWSPVVDGVAVRARTLELARSGRLKSDAAVMMGWNRNDGANFVPYDYKMSDSDRDTYFARRFGPNRVAALEAAYPLTAPQSSAVSAAFTSAQACETGWSYACEASFLADALPSSYVYVFSQPDADGLSLHGAEIKYVFGTLGSGASAADRALSSTMMEMWASFARTAAPTAAGADWPSWSGGGRNVLNISCAAAGGSSCTSEMEVLEWPTTPWRSGRSRPAASR